MPIGFRGLFNVRWLWMAMLQFGLVLVEMSTDTRTSPRRECTIYTDVGNSEKNQLVYLPFLAIPWLSQICPLVARESTTAPPGLRCLDLALTAIICCE